MLESIKTYIIGEYQVIARAPGTLAMATLALSVLIWTAISWEKNAVIEQLTGQIQLQDRQLADYKDKLNGASPSDAKARIDALEARVSRIESRRLSNEQKKIIIENAMLVARAFSALSIVSDIRCLDCNEYAEEFSDIFREVHWTIKTSMVDRPTTKSPKGIAVLSPDPNNPLPAAAALIRALKAANIPFDLMPGVDLNFSLQGIPAPLPVMIITAKITS
jgi:hypothetical protein